MMHLRNTRRSMVVAALVIATLLATFAGPAAAHEPGTTTIEIEIDGEAISAEIDMPIDRLEPVLDTTVATDTLGLSTQRELLVAYLTDHLQLRAEDGTPLEESVGRITVVTIDGLDFLRFDTLFASTADGDSNGDEDNGATGTLTLAYDAILEVDDSHQVIVTMLGIDSAAVVGVIDDDTPELLVALDVTTDSTTEGTAESAIDGAVDGGAGEVVDEGTATVGLMVAEGFEHVLEGADHMLFLLVLLLPAPLIAGRRRWQPSDGGWSALRKVVHVATAFTVGHSLTLAASALGWISLPTQPIELLIGVSVAVSAVHAIRPLAARGEIVIAGGFGLIHGMAFAGILDDLGLSRSMSLLSLLGFNIGIELAQLAIIGATFPSLWALSRTRAYPTVRVGGAMLAFVAASGWIVERLQLAGNPLASIESTAVDNVGPAVAALALTAAAVWLVHRRIERTASVGRLVG